jgi:hypothetical protein
LRLRVGALGGDVLEDHARISGQELASYSDRQVVCEPAIVFRAHANGAGTEAEEARIEIPERVHMLKVGHVGLDDGLQLGMLYRKRFTRNRYDTARFRQGDPPAQHALADHARCTEEKDFHKLFPLITGQGFEHHRYPRSYLFLLGVKLSESFRRRSRSRFQ